LPFPRGKDSFKIGFSTALYLHQTWPREAHGCPGAYNGDHEKLDLLGGITPAQFLRDYWHKKPLLIRNAIPGFTAPCRARNCSTWPAATRSNRA
jgi:hypothetical protein